MGISVWGIHVVLAVCILFTNELLSLNPCNVPVLSGLVILALFMQLLAFPLYSGISTSVYTHKINPVEGDL